MKVRRGFVTNSSSSSFIIGLDNKTEDKLKDELGECAEVVSKDILAAEKLDKREVVNLIKEAARDHVNFIFHVKSYEYPELAFKSTSEIDQILSTSERLIELREMKESKIIAPALEKLLFYDNIVVLEYEDHDPVSSKIEHDLLPGFSGTIFTINNH